MPISLKRVYDEPAASDGHRVLVDRLWPRGLTKEEAHIDEWLKEAAPSTALRKAFHADPSQWAEFRKHYLAELKKNRELLRPLAERARRGQVTLVYASREPKHNHAVVLKQYVEKLG